MAATTASRDTSECFGGVMAAHVRLVGWSAASSERRAMSMSAVKTHAAVRAYQCTPSRTDLVSAHDHEPNSYSHVARAMGLPECYLAQAEAHHGGVGRGVRASRGAEAF